MRLVYSEKNWLLQCKKKHYNRNTNEKGPVTHYNLMT